MAHMGEAIANAWPRRVPPPSSPWPFVSTRAVVIGRARGMR